MVKNNLIINVTFQKFAFIFLNNFLVWQFIFNLGESEFHNFIP